MSPHYSTSRSFTSFACFNGSDSQEEGSCLVSNLGNLAGLTLTMQAGLTQNLLYLAHKHRVLPQPVNTDFD